MHNLTVQWQGAKVINYKIAAQLVLSILNKKSDENNKDIFQTDISAMCDIPLDQCPICNAEKDYLKINKIKSN